ncbi:hydrolase [Pseudomonas matsuisoli]|uniref:Carbon-nitrogen hydrolase family protein n=1 Tax=Pseudomonas matsuisoli TaxID=1515666 RepID=A0A917PT94_9PSED|nr:hydrolase [Pseudomonas matsuisoli]GGJ91523.1 hypothetical protein GCM10009304_16640 [Pseudomonas matsuisoli]
MIRLFKLAALIALVGIGLALFLRWAEQRTHAHYLSDLRTHVVAGSRTAPLLLVQAQLTPVDYQSVDHLRLKLDTLLNRARDAGLLHEHTLVLLPDHIGTWLIATGEKVEFYQSRDRYEIRDWLLLGNPVLAFKALVSNLDAHRLDEALLRMKAEEMAQTYQRLFADLAQRYRVTLVAGSILLPSPALQDGELHAGDGPLRNTSLTFAPDGQIIGPIYTEAWPPERSTEQQQVSVDGTDYRVERDLEEGYPRSRLLRMDTSDRSTPVFLRGTLDWPIGGLPRRITLSAPAEVQSGPPGSHLIAEANAHERRPD